MACIEKFQGFQQSTGCDCHGCGSLQGSILGRWWVWWILYKKFDPFYIITSHVLRSPLMKVCFVMSVLIHHDHDHLTHLRIQEATQSFGNVACLNRVSDGCTSLKDGGAAGEWGGCQKGERLNKWFAAVQDKDTCLSSVDGSPYKQIAGLKAEQLDTVLWKWSCVMMIRICWRSLATVAIAAYDDHYEEEDDDEDYCHEDEDDDDNDAHHLKSRELFSYLWTMPATGWGSAMCLVRGRVTISEYCEFLLVETKIRPKTCSSSGFCCFDSYFMSARLWISIFFFFARWFRPKFTSGYAASMEICVSHMRWSSMEEVSLTMYFCISLHIELWSCWIHVWCAWV